MLNIKAENIFLNCCANNKTAALKIIADEFIRSHDVVADCFSALASREKTISTYINNGVAIPHLAKNNRDLIARNVIKIFQFPDGILWDKTHVMFIAIAILSQQDDEHIEVLKRLAPIIDNNIATYKLSSTHHKEDFVTTFARVDSIY